MIATLYTGALDADIPRDDEVYAYVGAATSPSTITYSLKGIVQAIVAVTYDGSGRCIERHITRVISS
jgi:hypothetical protein